MGSPQRDVRGRVREGISWTTVSNIALQAHKHRPPVLISAHDIEPTFGVKCSALTATRKTMEPRRQESKRLPSI